MFTWTQDEGRHLNGNVFTGSPDEFEGLQDWNPLGISQQPCRDVSPGTCRPFPFSFSFLFIFIHFIWIFWVQITYSKWFSGVRTHLSFWLPLQLVSYSNTFSSLSGYFLKGARLRSPAWEAHRPFVVSYQQSPGTPANRCSFSGRDARKGPVI